MNRREFLGSSITAGAALAATPLAMGASKPGDAQAEAQPEKPQKSGIKKLPIGVFNHPFTGMALDAMLDKYVSRGAEAIEVGSGRLQRHLAVPGGGTGGRQGQGAGVEEEVRRSRDSHPGVERAWELAAPGRGQGGGVREGFQGHDCAGGNAGDSHGGGFFRLPRRHAERQISRMDRLQVAGRVRRCAGMAMERADHSLLEGSGQIRAGSWRKADRLGDAS